MINLINKQINVINSQSVQFIFTYIALVGLKIVSMHFIETQSLARNNFLLRNLEQDPDCTGNPPGHGTHVQHMYNFTY